jgi:hypothetical protein
MNDGTEVRHSKERRIAFWLPVIVALIEAVGMLFVFGSPLGLWKKDPGEILIIAGCLLAITLPYLLLALAARSRSYLLFKGSLILTILTILADLLSLLNSDTCKEILVLIFVKVNEISVVMTLLVVLWVTAWYRNKGKQEGADRSAP